MILLLIQDSKVCPLLGSESQQRRLGERRVSFYSFAAGVTKGASRNGRHTLLVAREMVWSGSGIQHYFKHYMGFHE